MNRLAGLTLIELLVVIAIIAVLMPALSKGKAEAEKAFFAFSGISFVFIKEGAPGLTANSYGRNGQ